MAEQTDVEEDVWELEAEEGDDGPTNSFPLADTSRIQPSLTRFEAVLIDARLNPKGEWELKLKVPWSDREKAMALAEKHGVMLDFRVTSKPGG